jgi:hypothetical protein
MTNQVSLRLKAVSRIVDDLIIELRAKPEVMGIILHGGLGVSNHFDELSDVDLEVFVQKQNGNYPAWLPNFEFDVFYGKNLSQVQFNIRQLDIEIEKIIPWNDAKTQALSNGYIVFDRNYSLKELLISKTALNQDELINRLIKYYVQIPPMCLINPQKQRKRGHILLSHSILNDAIELLVDTLFIINNEFIPHYKWKFNIVQGLQYLPENFVFNLQECMKLIEFDEADVNRRFATINSIASELMLVIESRLNLSEKEIYQISCYQHLGRQLNPTAFSSILQTILEKKQLKLTELEQSVIMGFVNYHLISDLNQLMAVVNSFSNKESNIAGLEETRHLLTKVI